MSQRTIRSIATGPVIFFATIVTTFTLALSGCATQPRGSVSEPSTGTSPTAACPYVEGMATNSGCAYYDPDAAMALNERYRERGRITTETEAHGKAMFSEIMAALQPLSEPGTVRTQGAVKNALVNLGIDERGLQLDGGQPDATVVTFGISIKGGCVFGSVFDGQVQVDVGGWIKDGGCLEALNTH